MLVLYHKLSKEKASNAQSTTSILITKENDLASISNAALLFISRKYFRNVLTQQK